MVLVFIAVCCKLISNKRLNGTKCLFLLNGAKDQLVSKEKSRLMCVPLWRSDAGIHFPKRTIREKIPSEAIFPSTHFITLHIIDNLRVFLFSFYGRRFTVQRRSFFHARHIDISQFIISICSSVRTFCNTKKCINGNSTRIFFFFKE